MLTPEQKAQEDEYRIPYHYFVSRDSYFGLFYFSYLNKCTEIVSKHFGQKILDAGCGDGFFLSSLDDKQNSLFGLDYSERAISFAKILCSDRKIKFSVGRVEKTQFLENSFDLITSIAVLEHLRPEDLPMVFAEMYRILKDGGKLLVAVPTKNQRLPIKHFQHFDLLGIENLASDKFKTEKVYYLYNYRFDYLLKFFENRYFDIKIFSRYLKLKIFPAFFLNTSPNRAKMMLIVLKKIGRLDNLSGPR